MSGIYNWPFLSLLESPFVANFSFTHSLPTAPHYILARLCLGLIECLYYADLLGLSFGQF